MKTTVRFEWNNSERTLCVVLPAEFVQRFGVSEQQRVWNENLAHTWGWEYCEGNRRSLSRGVGADAALPYYKQAAIEEVKAALAYLKLKECVSAVERIVPPEIGDCVEVEV